MKRLWIAIPVIVLLVIIPFFLLDVLTKSNRFRSVEGWNQYKSIPETYNATDNRENAQFLSANLSESERYEELFLYFLHGFIVHAEPSFSRVHYYGYGSSNGFRISGLEGFARTTPLFAAWIYSGRNPVITDPKTGRKIDLVAMIRAGILAGTNPRDATYWGQIKDDDQRVVEAADIARTLWLTRIQIWDRLSPSERTQIATWLQQVDRVRIGNRNNWILFPVVVDTFLHVVGFKKSVDESNYEEFKGNYLESGWFFDRPVGVDYYNTWGISYDLYWLHLMDPKHDSVFLERVLRQSAELTSHLISPTGVPIMGRSICYRTAVPSPVIAAARLSQSGVAPGLARRSLDVTWRYFVAHGALRDGALTQGYFGSDPRFVDYYTGPGSCHWGLRSLTLAFMSNSDDEFWTAPYRPLPIERNDFVLNFEKLGWRINGKRTTGEILVTIPRNRQRGFETEKYSLFRRLYEIIFHRPKRPINHNVKYKLHTYSSNHPFAE